MTKTAHPYSPASVAPLPLRPAALPQRADWGRLRKDARLVASAYQHLAHEGRVLAGPCPHAELQAALIRCQSYLSALQPWKESHLAFLHAYRRAFPWTHEAHTEVGSRQLAILETFGVRNRQFALFAAARGYGMCHALVSDIYVAGDGVEGIKKAATIRALLEAQQAVARLKQGRSRLPGSAELLLQVEQ